MRFKQEYKKLTADNMPYTRKSKLNESLVQAIEADDCERVKRLLDKGADVNAKNSRSQPCLVIAAENHADVEIIRLLVSAPGVDVNAKESRGSALYFAVYNKDLDTAKVLLEHGAQLDYYQPRCSELRVAAYRGSFEMVKLLIPYAARQQSPEKLIEHEFFELVGDGSADIVRYYLCHDRSLANRYNGSMFNNCYPIHLAMRKDIAKILLEFCADVNALDASGSTALYRAVWGYADTCELLLSAGAIVDDPNKLIHHAVERRNGETLKALLAMPFAGNLDKSRIIDEPYYIYQSEISSSLHRAIQHNESHCTQHLLNHGFDPNICLKSGVTPAHLLLSHDHSAKHGSVFSQLKLLLGANADFEMKGDGYASGAAVTPFQLAMIRGYYVVANFLAESGCVNIHNVHQFVDLDLVKEKIDELCTCKRWFSFCNPNESWRAAVKILARPARLVDRIRNPRSLLELSRVAVRKQLNRRIDRVQETGLTQMLQDDVTLKNFINTALDCYEPKRKKCECGQRIIDW